jgi:acylphosphatase
VVSVRILIEGEKVQGVRYRLFLLEKAMESGIEKIYVRNIDKEGI